MKAWKEEIAQEIVNEWKSDSTINIPFIGETDRAVKLSAVAQKMGYHHINRADIRDIEKQVLKIAPGLNAVRFVQDPEHVMPSESAWNTLYFTDLMFD